jgi:hypothetical protein
VVLERLREQPILTAILEQDGTEVRPRSDGRVSLDLRPLVGLAGEGIIEALRVLAETSDCLAEDVHAALAQAVQSYVSPASDVAYVDGGEDERTDD